MTGGEGRTLASILHGIDAEEVESFLIISFTHCSVCGTHHVLMEKDMDNDMAKIMLGNAIGAIVLDDLGEL